MAGVAPTITPANATLTAYRIPNRRYLKIVPAPASREWMDVTTQGWANRCLPLRIANQSGWMILNSVAFEAVWDGTTRLDCIKIVTKNGEKAAAVNMFGFGVISWGIPYLFRTPPGYNLMVRGPANRSKDYITAFDAIVETDWLPYTFTMNWRFTQARKVVRFEKDEPICMLMPVRRGEVESFEPEIRNLESDPALFENYTKWHQNRVAAQDIAMRAARSKGPRTQQERVADLAASPKQGHYIRGEDHSGEQAHGHQTKLAVAEFVEREAASGLAASSKQAIDTAAAKKTFLQRFFGR